MPIGTRSNFRSRWLIAYNRIGHSLAVCPGIVIAYIIGLASTEFSFLFLVALVLILEAVILFSSWGYTRYVGSRSANALSDGNKS